MEFTNDILYLEAFNQVRPEGFYGYINVDLKGEITEVVRHPESTAELKIDVIKDYFTNNKERLKAISELRVLDDEMNRDEENKIDNLKAISAANNLEYNLYGKTKEVYDRRKELRSKL